jgi:aminoglycoside phosphotransferase (APT) family kinase protein
MIPAHLAALIPGCEEGAPPHLVQALPGGRGCNLVHRVDTDAGRFVLRQRQAPLNRPGSQAMTELRCQMAAAAAGLAPRIIQAAMDGSWLLMEYIDAPVWTESTLMSREGLERLGVRLAQLHALPVPNQVAPFDALDIATETLQQLQAAQLAVVAQFQPLLSRVQELSRQINAMEMPAVLNHGDLQAANMLGVGPVLIDWEYAQLVDPTYDIACLLTYYPALEPQLPSLLDGAGLHYQTVTEALALQRERFACLSRLWEALHSPKTG